MGYYLYFISRAYIYYILSHIYPWIGFIGLVMTTRHYTVRTLGQQFNLKPN